jgi:O-antigen ligase
MNLFSSDSLEAHFLQLNRRRHILATDTFAICMAAFLPWSTTVASIFAALSMASIFLTLNFANVVQSLKCPSRSLPLMLVAVAIIGTLWGNSTWPERFHALGPTAKLCAIPLFLFHFEKSPRASWVLMAFLLSSTCVLIVSWTVFFLPELTSRSLVNPGVPVKNYLDQSQEFIICLFGLAQLSKTLLDERRFKLLVPVAVLVAGLLANLTFVVSSRTSLLTLPVLFVLFLFLHFRPLPVFMIVIGSLAGAGLIWSASPYLKARVDNTVIEYREYQANVSSSVGKRLEFWDRSLVFIAAAPVFGNGTGSVNKLFKDAAVGQSGLSAEVTANPHNQILNVAVQWGGVGVVVLVSMWWSHLRLFRTTSSASWIGLSVVVQNIIGSLFNSHLFDFVEGWIYVIGVGVAGGIVARCRKHSLSPVANSRAGSV